MPTNPGASRAVIALDPDDCVGEIDRRLFGSFVEHLGRAVYTGIHEPGHPAADEHGFRSDVARLARELGVTLVRYPGGNFVSNYVWEDAVGPVAQRRPFRDRAWDTWEPNVVGTDEFLGWAERLGVTPMMAVNLGTRGATEAAALLEYCNAPVGTPWADRRAANGRRQPWGVPVWCLGNEMDGPWQIGHTTAGEYGHRAADAARAMRAVDPTVELVACGSSSMEMPTFGAWERTVLAETAGLVDHISMHAYYEESDGDRASFLGSGTAMDRFITEVGAAIDEVGAVGPGPARRPVTISFDEWNVWYRLTRPETLQDPLRDGSTEPPHLLEDIYSALDAVVVGDLLVTLLNHADRVRIGCLAQLVNVIAPIMTTPGGPAWRQPTFHPFAATAAWATGATLRAAVTTPTMATTRHGDVPVVTAAATWDEATGATALLAVNRSAEPLAVAVEHPGLRLRLEGGLQVLADHERAVAGPEHASAVERASVRQLPPGPGPDGGLAEVGRTDVVLPPESWTAWHGTAARA